MSDARSYLYLCRYRRQQQQQTASGVPGREAKLVVGLAVTFRRPLFFLFDQPHDSCFKHGETIVILPSRPLKKCSNSGITSSSSGMYNKHHIQWSQLQQRQQTSGIIMHSIGINDNHIESIEAAARSRVISNKNDCGGGAESSRMHKLQQQNNSSASVRQLTGCGMNDIDIDERDSDTEHENDKENVNKSTGTGSSTINRKAVAGAVNSSSSRRGNISRYALILRTYISIARSAMQDSDQL
jgi:hypothetical protein